MCTGSEFIAPSSAARCEIDLSGGGDELPAQVRRRLEARPAHGRATGNPRPATSSSARPAASSPAIHSATTPSRMSAAG